jgi:K+-sensing histidine kinase KdpD
MVRAMSAQRHLAHRDPEMLLRQLEAAERAERRGQLKIFLRYASGVGKSFKLFDEGRRRSRARRRRRHCGNAACGDA